MKYQTKFYQILNTGLSITSNVEDFFDLFNTDYKFFEIDTLSEKSPLDIFVHIDDRADNSFLSVGRKKFLLNGHPDKRLFALRIILREIYGHLKDFLILHAGVVGRKGKSLIFAGPSGSGKSTLVMEFLKRGYSFLSDDICLIHRQTQRVHPFPRSLWISEISFLAETRIKRKKDSITVDELPSHVAVKPHAPNAIFYLDTSEYFQRQYELEFGLKEKNEEVIQTLKQIEGIELKNLSKDRLRWRIQFPANHVLLSRIKTALEKFEDQIWEIFTVDQVFPDFTKIPVLTPVGNGEATFHLMACLRQRPFFNDGEKTDIYTPGKIYTKLFRFFNGIPCYRLTVGSLDKMTDLIEGALQV